MSNCIEVVNGPFVFPAHWIMAKATVVDCDKNRVEIVEGKMVFTPGFTTNRDFRWFFLTFVKPLVDDRKLTGGWKGCEIRFKDEFDDFQNVYEGDFAKLIEQKLGC